jgi:hypothetical protein
LRAGGPQPHAVAAPPPRGSREARARGGKRWCGRSPCDE